jgi:hypothetical protein
MNTVKKETEPAKPPLNTIWSGLFLLPPLVFWLSVQIGFNGESLGWLRLWRFLPDEFYPYLMLLLPLPTIVLGGLSLAKTTKSTSAGGVISGVLFVVLGILFEVYCVAKVFFPPF